MLFLLALPVFVGAAAFHRYLANYAPSNVLARRVCSGPARLRDVPVLIALAGACILAMHIVAGAVVAGAPAWLNVVVAVLAWDAIKFVVLTALRAAGACVPLMRSLKKGAADRLRRRDGEVAR